MSVNTAFLAAPEVRLFALEAALHAVAAGEAVISEDGDTITWNEPDCPSDGPGAQRLVGVTRSEGTWMPLVEPA